MKIRTYAMRRVLCTGPGRRAQLVAASQVPPFRRLSSSTKHSIVEEPDDLRKSNKTSTTNGDKKLVARKLTSKDALIDKILQCDTKKQLDKVMSVRKNHCYEVYKTVLESSAEKGWFVKVDVYFPKMLELCYSDSQTSTAYHTLINECLSSPSRKSAANSLRKFCKDAPTVAKEFLRWKLAKMLPITDFDHAAILVSILEDCEIKADPRMYLEMLQRSVNTFGLAEKYFKAIDDDDTLVHEAHRLMLDSCLLSNEPDYILKSLKILESLFDTPSIGPSMRDDLAKPVLHRIMLCSLVIGHTYLAEELLVAFESLGMTRHVLVDQLNELAVALKTDSGLGESIKQVLEATRNEYSNELPNGVAHLLSNEPVNTVLDTIAENLRKKARQAIPVSRRNPLGRQVIVAKLDAIANGFFRNRETIHRSECQKLSQQMALGSQKDKSVVLDLLVSLMSRASIEKAVEIMQVFRYSREFPSAKAYTTILESSSTAGRVDLVKEYFSEMMVVFHGSASVMQGYSTLFNLCISSKHENGAVFKELLVQHCKEADSPMKSISKVNGLFYRLFDDTLSSCEKDSELILAEEVLEFYSLCGFEINPSILHRMFRVAANALDNEKAEKYFTLAIKDTSSKNLYRACKAYNRMLYLCWKTRDFERAERTLQVCFKDSRGTPVELCGEYVLVKTIELLLGECPATDLVKATEIFERVKQCGLNPTVLMYTHLIRVANASNSEEQFTYMRLKNDLLENTNTPDTS